MPDVEPLTRLVMLEGAPLPPEPLVPEVWTPPLPPNCWAVTPTLPMVEMPVTEVDRGRSASATGSGAARVAAFPAGRVGGEADGLIRCITGCRTGGGIAADSAARAAGAGAARAAGGTGSQS